MEGGYKDSPKRAIYYSESKYTRDEFESIIIGAFRYVCEEIIPNLSNFTRCGFDLNFERICFAKGVNGYLNKWIEENSDLRILRSTEISMDIGNPFSPKYDTYKLLDNIDYAKMPDCKLECPNNEDYEKIWRRKHCYWEREKVKERLNSIEGLILVNPNEIYRFVLKKDNFIDYIESTMDLIRKHFPMAVVILQFSPDPECETYDILSAVIYDADGNYDYSFLVQNEEFTEENWALIDYYDIHDLILKLTKSDEYYKSLIEKNLESE